MTLATYEFLIDFLNDGFTADVTETGVTRIAGQYTNFNSATIRAADATRVRIGSQGMTPASFAAIIALDPDNAHNGAGQPASGYVFEWYLDANNYIVARYDKAAARWSVERVQAGSGGAVVLADTFNAGASIVLYIAGDGANTYVAVDGGAITSAANSRNPAIASSTVDIGYAPGLVGSRFEGAYAYVATFDAPLTAEQWQYLAAMQRPPLFGEFVGRTMVGLWLGKDTTYYDSALDIVTPELYECEARRGRSYASQLTGRSEAGEFSGVLRNSDGRYSTFNTASPLFGYVTPNVKTRLRAADATKHYALWSGFLENIEPQPGLPSLCTVTARGPLIKLSENRIGAVASSGALTGTIVGLILDGADWSATDRDIEAGQTTTSRWYSLNRGAIEALQEIEETEMGFILETRDGKIAYEDRHHRLLDALSVTSQATYSDAAGAAKPYLNVAQQTPLREIFNYARVEVQKYSVGAVAVLWTLQDETPVLQPGESRTWIAEYPSDASGGDSGAYVETWTTPVAGTDITQTGVANGDIGISVVKRSNDMTITVTNNNASVPATLTLVRAQGTPVTKLTPSVVSSQDATSIARYGQRSHQLPAKWLPNSNEARDYAGYVVDRYKEDHPVLQVTLDGTRDDTMLADVLTREISDRVTVVADNLKTNLGIDEDFFVESVGYKIDRRRVLTVDLAVSAVSGDSGFWILGTSELGVDTKVGY
jgi:hypothetical protein